MFELYGSTEAAISTFRRKGDPRGSVGEITDAAVKILSERGEECPPAELGADGKILNYARGGRRDLPRRRRHRASSRATSTTPRPTPASTATASTTRATSATSSSATASASSIFDGRTDDWIRKDGENFSALQVARLLQEHPDVVLAAAYGVPCAVSDELVMAAIKLRDGAQLRPQGVLRLLRAAGDGRQHGPQVVPRLRPPRRRVRVHRHREDPRAQPEGRALLPAPLARRAALLADARLHRATSPSRPRTTTACARLSKRPSALELLDR